MEADTHVQEFRDKFLARTEPSIGNPGSLQDFRLDFLQALSRIPHSRFATNSGLLMHKSSGSSGLKQALECAIRCK
jgi:hypothetical protein